MSKKKYYAVAVGRRPGIYTRWFGEGGARAQVEGFKGAVYKGFETVEAARGFMQTKPSGLKAAARSKREEKTRPAAASPETKGGAQAKRIVIYTDGSSRGNPGPGGYGVVIHARTKGRELSGGFRKTTNNRMELLACIVGLQQLKTPSTVDLYSDSRYVVDAMTKGWARRWQRNGWRKSTGQKALNVDLWSQLLALCERHDVKFIWVKGHAGNSANERCDQLATQAAAKANLPADKGYETS
jgi:ribonuclease HI